MASFRLLRNPWDEKVVCIKSWSHISPLTLGYIASKHLCTLGLILWNLSSGLLNVKRPRPQRKNKWVVWKGCCPQHGPKKRKKTCRKNQDPSFIVAVASRASNVATVWCIHRVLLQALEIDLAIFPPPKRQTTLPTTLHPSKKPQPPPYQSTWWNTHLSPTRPGPELNRDSDILPETTHLPQKGISMTFYSLCTGQGVSHSCHENKTQDP